VAQFCAITKDLACADLVNFDLLPGK